MLLLLFVAAVVSVPPKGVPVVLPACGDSSPALPALVFAPASASSCAPVPLVVAQHGHTGLWEMDPNAPNGCAGVHVSLRGVYQDWAENLVSKGYAVVFPDRFTAQGFDYLDEHNTPRACSGGPAPLTVNPPANDMLCALQWAHDQLWLTQKPVNMMGWSNGEYVMKQADESSEESFEFDGIAAKYNTKDSKTNNEAIAVPLPDNSPCPEGKSVFGRNKILFKEKFASVALPRGARALGVQPTTRRPTNKPTNRPTRKPTSRPTTRQPTKRPTTKYPTA